MSLASSERGANSPSSWLTAPRAQADALRDLLAELSVLDASCELDAAALAAHVHETKALLGDGLLGLGLWQRETGASVVGFGTSAESVALINQLVAEIRMTMENSGYPALRRYCLLSLSDGRILLVLRHGDDVLELLALDAEHVDLGVLFRQLVPKALAAVKGARTGR